MTSLSQIKTDSNWGLEAPKLNQNFQNISTDILKLKNSTIRFKGYHTSEEGLKSKYPAPQSGDYAWVGTPYPGKVYDVVNGQWHNTNQDPPAESVDLANYYTKEEINSITEGQDAKLLELEEKIGEGVGGALGGYKTVDSIDNLPPIGEENIGYIVGTKLYIYVGEGGDTLDGTYKDVGEFRGPQGEPGKPGEDGKNGADGVSLGEIALVQETGTDSGSENKVMSQKAVSQEFEKLSSSGSGNLILAWNTDEVTTRKSIPAGKRKQGMQISYKKDGNWINEQFVGTDLSDEKFPLDVFWVSMADNYVFFDEWVQGYLLSDGRLNSSANYKATPYISLLETNKFVYLFNTFQKESGTKGMCFYDQDKAFISGYDTEYGKTIYQRPEGAKFFRVCKAANRDGRVALSRSETISSLLIPKSDEGEKEENIINYIPDNFFKRGLIKKDGSVDTTTWQYLDFIRVIPGSKIKLTIQNSFGSSGTGGFLLYAFYSARSARSFISGKTYNDGEIPNFDEEVTIPDDAYYMRLTAPASRKSIKAIIVLSSMSWVYSISPQVEFKKTIIAVPKYIDFPSWRQTDIFLDNMIGKITELDANTVVFSELSQIGYNHLRAKNLSASKTVTITQYRDYVLNDIDNKATFTARSIKKTTTKTTVNILVIGDSLIQSSVPVEELYKLLQEDGDVTTINMIGTQGRSPYKHEGRGGWDFSKFISSSSPFYKNGKLDFKEYLKSVNPELTSIDIIIMSLGTNDIGGGNKYADVATISSTIEKAKILIDAATNAETGFPDAKVVVGMPAVGSPFMSLYSLQFKMSAHLLNEALVSTFDNGIYNPNVTCVAHGAYIDRINSYEHTQSNVTEYNEQQVSIYTNLLHPSAAGYKQFGRGYYGKVRAILAGNL